MAFQIRCPACSKLYAAEERMIGKKMRCKACASVFSIESPTQEPSLSAATMAGAESHMLSASDLTGTRRAEHIPPPQPMPPRSDEDDAPMAEERPFLKPSVPQDFPGALVVEAWLPLGLGLISAVWVISQTFGSNDTGRGWVPLLRLGVVALLYAALVIPVTYKAVKVNFRGMRRLLPPSPGIKTAATFALPAALGYEMWQASGGAGGYFMGLILGVALVAIVYWVLFRLNPQEAANSYAKVGGTFLATCGVAALIMVGGNTILNRSMLSEHGGTIFKESPLGEPLAWNWQEAPPAPVAKPDRRVAFPDTNSPGPQKQSNESPVPERNKLVAKAPDTAPPVPTVPETTVQENVVTEPVVNPPSKQVRPDVFVNPDDDSFMDSIRKNNFPWVKGITKAEGATPFDFVVSASGQSQFIGLVHVPDGRSGREIMLMPANHAVPPFQDDADQATFGSRYMLTNDGKALIHLRAENSLELIATVDNRRDPIALEAPASRVQMKPMLVGLGKGTTVVVRWAAPDATEQDVYRYDYMTRTKLGRTPIPKDPYTTPVVCAVSDSETTPTLYAWLSQMPGRPPQVKVINLQSASTSMTPRSCSMPADINDVTLFERGELAFSPDGSMLAMVLEQNGTARVLAWPTGGPVNSPVVRTTCKCPTSTEMAGHVRGPSVRWINRAFFVAYGRNVVGTIKHGIVGNLSDSDTLITGEQTTPDNKLYLTYTQPDGHMHLAAVEFEPHALNNATPVAGASH